MAKYLGNELWFEPTAQEEELAKTWSKTLEHAAELAKCREAEERRNACRDGSAAGIPEMEWAWREYSKGRLTWYYDRYTSALDAEEMFVRAMQGR